MMVLVICGFSAPSWAGDVYKCKGKHGETVYQNLPCADPARRVGHTTYSRGSYDSREDAGDLRHATQVFLRTHPDIVLGNNLTLMNQAIRELDNGHINTWRLLDDAYDRASASPRWTKAAPRAPSGPANQARRPPTRKVGGGIGSSDYARGDLHAVRCTTAKGRAYYAKGTCGTSTNYVGTTQRKWRDDTVVGMPGAVMVGPDQAIDPRTGRGAPLQHEAVTKPVYQTIKDHAESVSTNVACANAQKAQERHPFSKKITRRVQALCQQGRSLYETNPARGSMYYDGGK